MSLLGKGVLAIWNGIHPDAEAEFVRWHVQEHIPERVGLPGFLRGRRYVAEDGHPRYFNFYEAETAAVFASPAYVARLDAPTPWTRAVVAHFEDTSRTVCDVESSLGRGEGAWVEAVQFAGANPDGLASALKRELLPTIASAAEVVGVHLLRGHRPATAGMTAEMALRGRADDTADWILLVEAVRSQALQPTAASDEALARAGAADIRRGRYRLQYALTKSELLAS